jgi:hypothetical protein
MTPSRKQVPGRESSAPALSRESYPALADFLRGYLHQDFREEHGSVSAAVQAFRAAASREELRGLAEDAIRFGQLIRDARLGDVRRLLADELGSGWVPVTNAELRSFLALLCNQ